MKRKKYKDGDLQKHGFKDLQCVCGNYVRVNLDTTDVVCWQCVQKKVPINKKFLTPLAKKDPKPGRVEHCRLGAASNFGNSAYPALVSSRHFVAGPPRAIFLSLAITLDEFGG